jgi:hypothetical protein
MLPIVLTHEAPQMPLEWAAIEPAARRAQDEGAIIEIK